MIFCTNCGKQIDADSKFCPYCGAAVVKDNDPSPDEEISENNPLWDKFAEIRDSKGEKKEKYKNFVPSATWTLMGVFRENTLSDLLEKHPDEIGNLKYKNADLLGSFLFIATVDGYWISLAKRLLENKKLKKAKGLTQDELSDLWLKETKKDTEKVISSEVTEVMNIICEFDTKGIQEIEEVANLSKKVVDDLRTKVYQLNYWGFLLGMVEEKLK